MTQQNKTRTKKHANLARGDFLKYSGMGAANAWPAKIGFIFLSN